MPDRADASQAATLPRRQVTTFRHLVASRNAVREAITEHSHRKRKDKAFREGLRAVMDRDREISSILPADTWRPREVERGVGVVGGDGQNRLCGP